MMAESDSQENFPKEWTSAFFVTFAALLRESQKEKKKTWLVS